MGPSVNAEQRHHSWLGYSETDPAEVAEAQRILTFRSIDASSLRARMSSHAFP